jgi:hypothetical protein
MAVLICAIILPLITQVKASSAPMVASPGSQYLSALDAQKCHMTDCACPCCQHAHNHLYKSSCRCHSISLLSLYAVGTIAPVEQNSPSYAFYLTPESPITITDIFRPPQS